MEFGQVHKDCKLVFYVGLDKSVLYVDMTSLPVMASEEAHHDTKGLVRGCGGENFVVIFAFSLTVATGNQSDFVLPGAVS